MTGLRPGGATELLDKPTVPIYASLVSWTLRFGPAIVLGIGAVLRVRAYFFAIPFYIDEAMLAQNIEARSFRQLFEPLDLSQAAPPGFLVLQKIIGQILGGGTEFAYRVLPFVCSLIVLWMNLALARKLLDRVGVLIACLIVSLSWPLAYYAAINKQYETEGLVASVLLFLWLRAEEETSGKRALAYTLTCFVSPWFSLSAPFVIVAMEAGTFVQGIRHGLRRLLVRRAPVYISFAASCATLYMLVVHGTERNQVLQDFWAYAFMPLPPRSLSDIRWFIGTLQEMFRRPVGLPDPGIAPFLVLAGVLVFWRQSVARAWAIPGILAWVLLASGFKLYPFGDRLLLFAVVPLALTIGAGFSGVALFFSNGSGEGRILKLILGAVLVGPLLLTGASRMARPTTVQDFRKSFSYIDTNWQPRDQVVTQWAYAVQIQWYHDHWRRMPVLGKRPITVAPKWSSCEDVHRVFQDREGDGRIWALLYKSENSKVFDWCAAEIGVEHVLSTPDDELYLYVPGRQSRNPHAPVIDASR